MTSLRRTVATVGSVAVALLLVSCGVDAGDAAPSNDTTPSETTTPDSKTTTPDTKTTTPDKELSPTEQAAADRVQQMYEDLGMEPDDAECLAEAIAGSIETFDPSDTSAMMDIINQCDISMSELNDFGQEQGLDSMEDGLKFGLEESLKSAGLTDDQAACVADAYVDEFGTDVTAGQDVEKMRPLFEGCDVDPSLIPGG